MTNLFGHNVRSEMVFVCVAEALAVFLAIFGLLAWGGAGEPLAGPVEAACIAAALAVWSGLASGASGLYQPDNGERVSRPLAGALVAATLLLAVAWAGQSLFALTDTPGALARFLGVVLLGWLVGALAARAACLGATRTGLVRRRILVFGPTGAADRAPDLLDISHAPLASMTPDDALRPDRLRSQQVWAIVATDPSALTPALRQHCQDAGVQVLSEDAFEECRLNRVASDRLAMDWLSTARVARESRAEAVLRRCFDILVGLLLVVMTLPVILVAAAAVRLTSPGPVFYRQTRSGLGGRVFTLFKFRSMRVDAEAGGVPVWATRRDPRVTRVGRFLRLTRIDELPQVLNVLRGDMSIVGPRPERPGFVEELGRVIPHYHDRACVRPGITGWAQVKYPYGASVEDARMKLAYDLYYVRNRSLFLDLLILVATVRVVLFQEGAR